MINARIHEVANYTCSTESLALPVVIELLSTKTVEVSSKIDLKQLTLKPVSGAGEDLWGRGTLCHLGNPSSFFELSAAQPYFLVYDVFEIEPQSSNVPPPGRYELSLHLTLYLRDSAGIEKIHVRNSKEITITTRWLNRS